jgi:primary-amine oxidase
VVISLDTDTMTSCDVIPGVRISFLAEESAEVRKIVCEHPDFLAALERRGISDPEQVLIEGFAVANLAQPDERHLRHTRGHCFFRENPQDNAYARPIEGLVPVVDLNNRKVLRIEDNGVVPLPPDLGNYRSDQLDTREPLAPLDITQPDGSDFKVDGYAVEWQNWRFRVGFTPKEGLVLHTLSFRDGDTHRPVMYRASLSELVVPYGDTAGDHYMNHSFDLGETIFGKQVNSLKLGCDCLGEIYYFDFDQVDELGNPLELSQVVCMHEEDYGVLWKHTDAHTQRSEVRRSRRLVVSSFFTIGNYDYGIFWYLYLDGTIEFEAKLTGTLYLRAISEGEETPYGSLVAPGVNGMVHEHYFNVRLDMSVDGDANTVVEMQADRIPMGSNNPHGNAHGVSQIVITSEQEGVRNTAPKDSRFWKIENRSRSNQLGWHPAYKLMPGPNVAPMHQPGSPFMRRAGFVAYDLWVTAYDPDELHAPGQYISQNEGGPGLPEWIQKDRNLVDTDVVLWHTVGVLHLPRPEDFPVMPVEYTGFMLKPFGFFERNPAINLAPPLCRQ